ISPEDSRQFYNCPFRHPERSRGISNYSLPKKTRDVSTSLDITEWPQESTHRRNLVARDNQIDRATRIYSNWQRLRQLRKFPKSLRSGRPFPKQAVPKRGRKKLRPP